MPTSDEPDLSRLELDALLEQLVERAQDVMGAQDRLRGLLRASQVIVADLALPIVLRRIAEAARDLARARYAALGVLGPDGGLEQFLHVGIDDDLVAGIGHLPEGKGLLGALMADPRPIRIATIGTDRRSVGFPADHPPMDSFLGVPIRVRDEVYGNLYLTEREGGGFTAEDEELVTALAAAAATAIENARLYAESQRRQAWLQASTDITRQLLTPGDERPLHLIARTLHHLTDADLVLVSLPAADAEQVRIDTAIGQGADELLEAVYPMEGTVTGQAFRSGRPAVMADVSRESGHMLYVSPGVLAGPLMAVPMVSGLDVRGVLIAARRHARAQFADAELEMAMTFANHAAISLELADARADQQRAALLEERDRIARGLHDHVVQRLFATGLTVQSVASGLRDMPQAGRLNKIVQDLDATIRQIRRSVFELRGG
ncbi:MAG TPA: GAF domain-containing protein [Jatrophihabitantaceae bacterium]|jgi:GAF domain-containing protein